VNLYAFDIPDDPSHLPAWLEGHLTGLDLAGLVAELTAVHGQGDRPDLDLDHFLGDQKQIVLDRGLGSLSAESLRQLLLHPRLLLELQDLVCREGGPYWNSVKPDLVHAGHIQRGSKNLQKVLASWDGSRGQDIRSGLRWYQRSWFASVATAASLLAVFIGYDQLRRRLPDNNNRPPPPADSGAWGWNKANALPEDVSRSTYLDRLAAEADEWFKERPTDAVGLAKRIHQFRAGCTRLIFVVHRPLPHADQQWLIENCRIWGRKLDKQLAALESGQNALEVRADTDELVRQVVDALRLQARKAA
jgi:hypothetical protein